jgi:hypothetical protein
MGSIAGVEFSVSGGRAEHEPQRRRDCVIGKLRQSLSDAHHLPNATEVEERDQQRRLLFEATQQCHDLGVALRGGDRGRVGV